MKKVLALVLSCVMVLSLMACGADTKKEETTTAATTAAATTAAETEAETDAETEAETEASAVVFEKTITLVIPYAAGGGIYNAAMLLVGRAGEILGQTINVVCMEGNGGQEGIEYVYNQDSDGYTLLATDYGPLISTAIEEEVIYELDEFTPIMEMTTTIPTFFVKADSPYQTMEELIQAAIDNPGTISVGHGKYHSVPHLPLILLEEVSGADFNEVPTSGGSEAKQFVLGGSVDAGASVPSTVAGEVEEGLLRVLAVACDERIEQFPDVPTLKELGYEVSMPAWYSIFSKSDVPEAVRAAIEAAFVAAANDPDVLAAAAEANIVLTGTGSEDCLAAYNTTIENLTTLLGE